MSIRALITGVNGFVGSHMLDLLLTHDVSVTGLGRRSIPIQVKSAWRYKVCDLTDYPMVERALGDGDFDVVVHLAGIGAASIARSHPRDTLMANVVGTWNLLECLRQTQGNRLRRLVIAGSAQEYDSRGGARLREDAALAPDSPYGWSKYMQTSVAQMYAAAYGLPIVVARAFNLIGPGARNGICVELAQQVADIEAGRLAPCISLKNPAIERDFLDVRDAAQAFWALLQAPAVQNGEIYNVCSGHAISVAELATLFHTQSHAPFTVGTVEPHPHREEPPRLCGDNGKLCATTGWTPTTPLAQTVADILGAVRGGGPDTARRGSH